MSKYRKVRPWRAYRSMGKRSCLVWWPRIWTRNTVEPMRTSGTGRDSCNRQYLWIKIFYAASSVAVVSSGRSTSVPFSNFAPARTSATRWGALTARQRDWAASISL